MNLDEIREIVDFMKENGLCELEYSEKNTSVRLKLAPPPPPRHHHHPCPPPEAPAPEQGEETPEAVKVEVTPVEEDEENPIISDEVKQAAAEAAAIAAAEVKKAAEKAAAAVSESIKAGADFLKTKREEYKPSQPVEVELDGEDDEEEVDESILGEVDDVVTPEEDSSVKLDTAAAKRAVEKTAETLLNTAKAGATLGKMGILHGKHVLTDFIKSKQDSKAEEDPAAEDDTEE
jgi:hypothetical protein